MAKGLEELKKNSDTKKATIGLTMMTIVVGIAKLVNKMNEKKDK